jgi:CubicO group peptidase (beta-lactamase class C family)
MDAERPGDGLLSRRSFMRELLATAVSAALVPAMMGTPVAARAQADDGSDHLFRELDQKIRSGMRAFAIPGVAVGVIHQGKEYVRGYGVADVGNPQPVDANTVFRIASTSKTFTGTTAMRLADAGQLELDAEVRRYITHFRPPKGAAGVTVRQLLNHSAGWLGYDYHDTGADDRALARYVHDVRRLPQLTPVGQTFSYNNTAISVAGRVIETITGTTFESSVRKMVLDPLGLTRSGYSTDETGTENVAAPHDIEDGKAVANPDLFFLPRSGNPFGGLLSSMTDQLAYARLHLGDGRAADGQRVMSEAALRAMWSQPGPGGTLLVELDGMGVSWMVRPTAEGVTVVQHGGDLPGFHSGFLLVPEKGFAITMLTNSESGPQLIAQLFYDDWALRRFAGVRNLPAVPRTLSEADLAPYEGHYTAQQIGFDDTTVDLPVELAGSDGGLKMTEGAGDDSTTRMLTFYKDDYVLVDNIGLRANFLRDVNGRVAWLRFGGRLFRHLS